MPRAKEVTVTIADKPGALRHRSVGLLNSGVSANTAAGEPITALDSTCNIDAAPKQPPPRG